LLGGARQKEGWSSNESMALAMVEELLKSS